MISLAKRDQMEGVPVLGDCLDVHLLNNIFSHVFNLHVDYLLFAYIRLCFAALHQFQVLKVKISLQVHVFESFV